MTNQPTTETSSAYPPADDRLRHLLAQRINCHVDTWKLAFFIAGAVEDDPEIRAEVLPAWVAMYEPGNVSDYLIGYANSEAGAKGAAEAWMRSEAEVTGRLEWVSQSPLSGYDAEFELVERHDDGVDTGPGITVRRRAAVSGVAR